MRVPLELKLSITLPIIVSKPGTSEIVFFCKKMPHTLFKNKFSTNDISANSFQQPFSNDDFQWNYNNHESNNTKV